MEVIQVNANNTITKYHRFEKGQRVVITNKCSHYYKTRATVIKTFQGCASLYMLEMCDKSRKLYQDREFKKVDATRDIDVVE